MKPQLLLPRQNAALRLDEPTADQPTNVTVNRRSRLGGKQLAHRGRPECTSDHCRAFHYGAPPHGGMAAGVDRIVMLLAGEQNLREVALFPMNQRAEDLLMGAPSPPTPKQLRELHIRVVSPEK